MTVHKFLPPYIDLDQGFVRPTTGQPGQMGWWRQVAYNLEEIWYSLYIEGGPVGNYGAIVISSADGDGDLPWQGLTPANQQGALDYIRIGQEVWVWAYDEFSALSDGVSLTLPEPPADSNLTMTVGRGWVGSSTAPKLVGAYIDQDKVLKLHGTSGQPVDSTYHAGAGFISIEARYRCVPESGRLSGRSYVIEEQD